MNYTLLIFPGVRLASCVSRDGWSKGLFLHVAGVGEPVNAW